VAVAQAAAPLFADVEKEPAVETIAEATWCFVIRFCLKKESVRFGL
jgi:hypothetical protein